MTVYGSLFSGYEGLTEGVKQTLGPGRTAWVSDIDPGANKILAHRFPDVPNIGDITKVDWSQVEPVDVLTAGFPCQDVSSAGKRAGLRHGTRSGLWTELAKAIATIRPRLVVIENVRGLLSARGDEPTDAHLQAENTARACKHLTKWIDRRRARALREGRTEDARRLATHRGRVMGCRKRALARAVWHERRLVRAIGTVLGDLADIGYDCRWHGLRAADVGAPHGRSRVFLVAYPAGHAHVPGLEGRWVGGRGAGERVAGPAGGEPALLPTPAAYDGERGGPQHPDKRRDGGHSVTLQDVVHGLALLPTPAVNDMGEGKTVEAWDEWTAAMQARHGNGNGHGKSLAIEAQRLLPTPAARDYKGGQMPDSEERLTTARGDGGTSDLCSAAMWVGNESRWGQYADAITRWETLTRPAPPPTQPSKKGTPQLSPRFSEWMQGLPDGWVTDVPGITRNEALKAIGNGVCVQQCAAALRFLLGAGTPPIRTREPAVLLPSPSAQEPGYTGPLVDEDGQSVQHTSQRTFDPVTGRMVQTGLEQTLRVLASDAANRENHDRGGSDELLLPGVAELLAEGGAG